MFRKPLHGSVVGTVGQEGNPLSGVDINFSNKILERSSLINPSANKWLAGLLRR